LALSFHVDYWDRLGWKDPFSSPDATRRQHGYADLLRLATVYTPQVVVDGGWQAVGSDRSEVERALGSARRNHDDVPIALAVDHGQVQITLGRGGDGVRGIDEVAQFDGRARALKVPIRWPCDRVAAILQARDGRVIGVATGDADAR